MQSNSKSFAVGFWIFENKLGYLQLLQSILKQYKYFLYTQK